MPPMLLKKVLEVFFVCVWTWRTYIEHTAQVKLSVNTTDSSFITGFVEAMPSATISITAPELRILVSEGV